MADIMEIPASWSSEDSKLSWLQEFIASGKRFCETQPGWKDIEKATEVLSGGVEQRKAEGVSSVNINFVQRFFKELIAQLTNLNPKWCYLGQNKMYKETETVLNKCWKSWWPNVYGTLKIKEALQHAGTGKGWIEPYWEPNFYGPGKGEINLKVHGAKDVFPIMLPRNGDVQRGLGVVIREEVPLHDARSMWPELRHKITPSRGRATWLGEGGGTTMFSKYMSPVLKMMGQERERREYDKIFPTVDIYYCYIQDPALNESGKTIAMGSPGTPWYYEVPSMGTQIGTGTYSQNGIDENGQPKMVENMRVVEAHDARMYPFRRLIIATDNCIIKDDTSPWWHGQAPVIPFDIYKWAWEFISRPFTSQIMDLQDAYTQLFRTLIDSANLRLDPPLAFDSKTHSMQQMKSFTPRKPGGRLSMDFTYGVTVKPLMDVQYYDSPNWIIDLVDKMPQLMQKMAGINDAENLAKANQIPSDDTISKIMDIQGPVVEDQAREMERSLQKLGEMVKWLFFEFYTTARRMQILGADGLTEEDFDYEPGLMIPDHLPGENNDKPSKYSLAQRAQSHANNFIFHITPQSSYNITDMQRQLLYLQLYRNGFPIDPGTVAEVLGIPNWGDIGDGPIVEKWAKWQEVQLQLQTALQQQATMAQAETQMAVQGAAMAQLGPEAMAMQGLAGMAGQQGQQQGRPPSGQEPPKMEQKNGPDGPRTTISESG